jgi:hypothetical protein
MTIKFNNIFILIPAYQTSPFATIQCLSKGKECISDKRMLKIWKVYITAVKICRTGEGALL